MLVMIFIALNVNMKQMLVIKSGIKFKQIWNTRRKIKHSNEDFFGVGGGR